MSDNPRYVEVIEFHKDDTIFREGDPGGCMYIVQSGRVGIVANYGTDREKLLTELGEGAFFGEMGMVRGLPRSATAVALEGHTGISIVTWPDLGLYFRESPAKIVGIMQQMANRIGEISGDYLEACGAVHSLLEQRGRVMQESASLHRTLTRLEDNLVKFSGAERDELPEIPPLYAPDPEDDARYKKFAEAYRRHRSRR